MSKYEALGTGPLTPEQLDGMEMWDRDVMLAEPHRAVGAMLVRRACAEIRELRLCADRAVTIADEAFGAGPVEPLDATLSRIERGIHDQAKELREMCEHCDVGSMAHDSTRASLSALLQATAADKERVRQVVRESMLISMEDQMSHVGDGDSILRFGSAERRRKLEFIADSASSRAAEQLATPAVRMSPDVIRGLELMRQHLDEGGHNWSGGTDMADVEAARDWLDRKHGAP